MRIFRQDPFIKFVFPMGTGVIGLSGSAFYAFREGGLAVATAVLGAGAVGAAFSYWLRRHAPAAVLYVLSAVLFLLSLLLIYHRMVDPVVATLLLGAMSGMCVEYGITTLRKERPRLPRATLKTGLRCAILLLVLVIVVLMIALPPLEGLKWAWVASVLLTLVSAVTLFVPEKY